MRLRTSFAWLMTCAGAALAQDPPPNVSTGQRGGTYVAPPAAVDPVYLPGARGTEKEPVSAASPLTLQLSLDMPLRGGGSASLGRGVQGSTSASPTLQALLRWRPIPDSHWFVQGVFYRYLRGDRQQPWHPDFTYAFGYDDWHPGTWSLVYANYTGTRFDPDPAAGEHRFNFPQGQWTLGYKFSLPQPLDRWLLVGDDDQAICSGNAHYTPRYVAFSTGGVRSGKTAASLGCRYQRPGGWFVEGALYAWPGGSQQQPWDPDFTYGFGYADWRPGALSLRYSNYSGNRFPGRLRGAGEGTFRSGSLTLTWSTEW